MVCQNIGDAEFTFGLTAPTGIRAGHRWVDSSSGILFTFVDDFDPSGQTGQWVAFDNSPVMIGPTGPQGIQGPTGATGNTGGAEYLYQLLDVNIDSETDYVSANDGKFLKYDNSITKWVMASIPLNLLSGICGGIVGSINGCTGDISIIGTTNEIEILNEACPQFQIGLPDNVTITGNLTVLGNYNGYVDGGVF
jgi:hypothetical protein